MHNNQLSPHYHAIFYITDKNEHGLHCRNPWSDVLPSFGWWDTYNIYKLRNITDPAENRLFRCITFNQHMLDVAWLMNDTHHQ